jgi:hypothetical protein
MGENDVMANDLITAIIDKFNDDDEDVRAASVRALGELATDGKDAHDVVMFTS